MMSTVWKNTNDTKVWKRCTRYEKDAQVIKCVFRYEKGVFLKNSDFSYLYYPFWVWKKSLFFPDGFMMTGAVDVTLLCSNLSWDSGDLGKTLWLCETTVWWWYEIYKCGSRKSEFASLRNTKRQPLIDPVRPIEICWKDLERTYQRNTWLSSERSSFPTA